MSWFFLPWSNEAPITKKTDLPRKRQLMMPVYAWVRLCYYTSMYMHLCAPEVAIKLMRNRVCGCFKCEDKTERNGLTALLHGLIRPVFAVFHVVTHFVAVDTLPVLTAELPWPITLSNCIKQRIECGEGNKCGTFVWKIMPENFGAVCAKTTVKLFLWVKERGLRLVMFCWGFNWRSLFGAKHIKAKEAQEQEIQLILSSTATSWFYSTFLEKYGFEPGGILRDIQI